MLIANSEKPLSRFFLLVQLYVENLNSETVSFAKYVRSIRVYPICPHFFEASVQLTMLALKNCDSYLLNYIGTKHPFLFKKAT